MRLNPTKCHYMCLGKNKENGKFNFGNIDQLMTSKAFQSSNFHSESQESFSSSEDRCWIRAWSNWSILLLSCSIDGSLTSGSISGNGSNGSKQICPFFSAFVNPKPFVIKPLEVTCSPFRCGHVIVEISKPFRMNRFYSSKSEFNLDLFDFFTFAFFDLFLGVFNIFPSVFWVIPFL